MLEAAAQAYAFFLGSYETSSTTATYCLYELAQHQEIQNKVREEIDETLKKHGELTYNAVTEMEYLHKVVNGKYYFDLCVDIFFNNLFLIFLIFFITYFLITNQKY